MKTLGYLGLGVMGYGMTGNLIDKSGCDIYGYDPVPALRERFAARGGKVVKKPSPVSAETKKRER